MSAALVIFLGLANWIGTVIVVDSELFRPLRWWVEDRYINADGRWPLVAWGKAKYLVSCHLCAGTWVGLAIALVAGSPVPGLLGLVLGGLIFKAIGHVTLEVTAALKRVAA